MRRTDRKMCILTDRKLFDESLTLHPSFSEMASHAYMCSPWGDIYGTNLDGSIRGFMRTWGKDVSEDLVFLYLYEIGEVENDNRAEKLYLEDSDRYTGAKFIPDDAHALLKRN